MLSIIEAVESSGLATWVRQSTSLYGYTLILSLHAMGLAIVVGMSTAISLRLLGVAAGIPLAPTLKFFPIIYAGFWLNAISGFVLLAASASSMLSNVMFFIKLGFIALAVLSLRLIKNGLIGDSDLLDAGPVSGQMRLLAVGSIVFWGGALVAGRLTAYPYLVSSWFGI